MNFIPKLIKFQTILGFKLFLWSEYRLIIRNPRFREIIILSSGNSEFWDQFRV